MSLGSFLAVEGFNGLSVGSVGRDRVGTYSLPKQRRNEDFGSIGRDAAYLRAIQVLERRHRILALQSQISELEKKRKTSSIAATLNEIFDQLDTEIGRAMKETCLLYTSDAADE